MVYVDKNGNRKSFINLPGFYTCWYRREDGSLVGYVYHKNKTLVTIIYL